MEVTCALAGIWHFLRSTRWFRGCYATTALSWLILGDLSKLTRPSLSSRRAWRCMLRKHRLGCTYGAAVSHLVLSAARKGHDGVRMRRIGVRRSHFNVAQESSRPDLIWRTNYDRRQLGKGLVCIPVPILLLLLQWSFPAHISTELCLPPSLSPNTNIVPLPQGVAVDLAQTA